MSYNKPELVPLASAIEAIAGLCEKPACFASDVPHDDGTIPAYEADE